MSPFENPALLEFGGIGDASKKPSENIVFFDDMRRERNLRCNINDLAAINHVQFFATNYAESRDATVK
jgi:hypothetical protein